MHARSTRDAAPPAARTAPRPADAGDGLRRWLPLLLLGAAQFMLVIDVTVVNVALPSIGRDLALDRAALTWVPIAYTLFFGSLLLLGGRLADTIGRRRVFLAGLGLFTVASIGSGLAPDATVLIAARALQGVGAALLSPAALSIVTTRYQGPDRNRALGVWAALGGSGAAFGVVLGGLLASGPGWQSIFFVNAPIGILVGLAAARIIPALAPDRSASGLDLPGVLLVVPALGLLLYALIGAADVGWLSGSTLTPIGLAAILAIAFAWRERSASSPLVRLDMLGQRTLAGSIVLVVAASAILAGVFFLVSLFVQRLAGMTALETGLLFLPVALAMIVGSQVGSQLVGHAGGRITAAAGLAAAAAGLVLLSQIPPRPDVPVDVLPGFVIVGLGIGTTLVAAFTSAFSGVADEDSGLASGLVNTSHELGFALGVSILSAVGGAGLMSGADTTGFQAAFLAAAGIALAAIAITLALVRDGRRIPRPAFAH